MKKALISPDEPRTDREGNPGFRVADVRREEYDVAQPLFWVECPEDCVKDFWAYVNGKLVDITPQPEEAPDVELPPPPIDTHIEL